MKILLKNILLFLSIIIGSKLFIRSAMISTGISITNKIYSQAGFGMRDFTNDNNRTVGTYKQNSPGNTAGNRYEIYRASIDSTNYRYKRIFYDSLATRNDGTITGSLFWRGANGELKVSPTTSLSLPINNITNLQTSLTSIQTSINANTSSITSLQTNKFNVPSGNSSQYIDGTGTLKTFPTISQNYTLTAGNNISMLGSYPNQTINAIGVQTEIDPTFNSSPASIITNMNVSNWNTSFSWGNHVGLYRSITYVPNYTDIPGRPALSTVATTGTYTDLIGIPATLTITQGSNMLVSGNSPNFTISAITPTNNNQLSNGNNYQSASDVSTSYYNKSQSDAKYLITETQSLVVNSTSLSIKSGTTVVNTVILPSQVTQTLIAGKNTIISSASNVFTVGAIKSYTTYTGNTNSSGNYTVNFGTPYSTTPTCFPSIPNQSDLNSLPIVTGISTTGFTVNVFTRANISSLPIIGSLGLLLLGANTTPVNAQTVDVLIIEK